MVGEPEPGSLIAQKYPARERQWQNEQSRPGLAKGLLHGAVISYDFRSFRKTNLKSKGEVEFTACRHDDRPGRVTIRRR
jgi:hypothetical protein